MEKETSARLGVDFTQPSTWRGLALLLSTTCGVALSPDQLEAFIAVGVAISGAIGVFISEPK